MTSGPALRFDILARSSATRARLGRVTTPHGSFDTPAFMPVGTRASVKGVLPAQVVATGAQIVLGNTYHLMLRPGSELIQRMGGLHRFMNWPAPILTDSGGYQAYSMADLNKVTDDGVTFRSIVDGSLIHLTPERAIEIQNQLGADVIMAFDDCPPSETPSPREQTGRRIHAPPAAPADRRLTRAIQRDAAGARGAYIHAHRLRQANERTVRWLERCKAAHDAGPRAGDQALFGIVQGGTDLAERTWSAERITAIDLPGYAIGGVAVGEGSEEIASVVRHTAPLLPEDRPRYLMGVGYERDLLAAVLAGVDMFDCVLPTRNARNANAFTSAGQIRLRNAQFAEDPRPIEPGCDCAACAPAPALSPSGSGGGEGSAASRLPLQGPSEIPAPFSRSYIRHLFMAGEMLGPILVTLHNLRHFQQFMLDIRRTLLDDDWPAFVTRWPAAAAGLPPGLAAAVPSADHASTGATGTGRRPTL